MSSPQGLISFPGLTTFTRAEYVLSHGISPGTCTIEMPQELISDLEMSGDLTFSYADESFTLYNCVVDSANIDRGLGGFIARVQILDRRWQWRFGAISGHYNLPAPQANNSSIGTAIQSPVRPDTEKTPQQLATLCLQAMGEQNYDVSALPNGPRPEVHWSYQVPAQALCEQLGCRVVLWTDDDSVRIVKIGVGEGLPQNAAIQWVSEGLNPPEAPSSLVCVGGQTVFQSPIALQAVGLDMDDSIKPINSLSYTPPNGWSSEDPKQMPNVTNAAARARALRTVYRWWRPKIPFTAPDNQTQITDIKQLLLFDRQVNTYSDPNNPANNVTQQPIVIGNFDQNYAQTSYTSQAINTYRGEIQIDQTRGIVITGDPLYQLVANTLYPAVLSVVTSFSCRDPSTGEPLRYTRQRPLAEAQNQTQPQIIRRDELVRKVIANFSTAGGGIAFSGAQDNQPVVDQQADSYLDAAESEYVVAESFDIPYAGLVPIQVDGTIRQVTYSIVSGNGGSTTTRASVNVEHNPYVPKYKVRNALHNLILDSGPFSRKGQSATVMPEYLRDTQGQPYVK